MSKSMLRNFFAVAIATSCAAGVQADNKQGFYAGAGAAILDGNIQDANGSTADFRTVEIIGGYKYRDWACGEIRLGTGFSEETLAVATGADTVERFDVHVDHYESIYYRPEVINQTAKLYGLLGFTNLQVSNKGNGISRSSSDSGLSYGFGIGFVMNDNLNLNFEYRELLSKNDTSFTALEIGLDWRI